MVLQADETIRKRRLEAAILQADRRVDLFDEELKTQRATDYQQVAAYLVERLSTIFAEVQKTPYPLYNSKNCPLYLLTFAAGNKRGAKTALKIANHLLKG